MNVEHKKLSLVVPCYNEEKSIDLFLQDVHQVFEKIQTTYEFEVLCVNDGSRDGTLDKLKSLHKIYPYLRIFDFSRNFGKEAALTAGLDYATGDIVVPIDADLQHPPELILKMLEKWEEGFEVVLAKRIDRDTDKFIQKITARSFYKLSSKISHIEIPADVGDFRLMDRKVVEAIKLLKENSRFMKGIFAWVGFHTTTIEYKVEARKYGNSSFNTWKLWNFALEGITSFSSVPLRIWTYVGFFVSMLSFIYGIFLFFKTMIFGIEVAGYASLMVVLLFSAGVQLIGIGVLGEYIGRIFSEVKKRPSYVVREVIE